MSNKKTKQVENANKITVRRSIYAAGTGLIPFPLLDVASLLGVQIIMIRDIAREFDLQSEYKKNIIKNWIVTLVGDLGTVGVFSGVKAIPVVGNIVGMFGAPLAGGAATYALGKVFTSHFAQGGTLLDFDPDSPSTKRAMKKGQEEGEEFLRNKGLGTADSDGDGEITVDELDDKIKSLKEAEAELEKLKDKILKETAESANKAAAKAKKAAEVAQKAADDAAKAASSK